jgi:hypothetical protein
MAVTIYRAEGKGGENVAMSACELFLRYGNDRLFQ